MTVYLVFGLIIFSLGLLIYYLIGKAKKYQILLLNAIQSLALEQEHRRKEADYRNDIEKKLEEREKIILKISNGEYSIDELNDIRSGMLPAFKKSIN